MVVVAMVEIVARVHGPHHSLLELQGQYSGILYLNRLAAHIACESADLLDFRRSPISDVSDRSSLRRARILTIFFGILGTLLALVVMKHLGTLVQAVNTIFGIFGGPLLGIFGLGVLSRRANTPGALAGALAGALVGISVAFSGPWLWNLLHVDLVFVCDHDANRRLAGKFSLCSSR